MRLPTKEELETGTKVLALIGGSFTAAKSLLFWAIDQSSERKISKITERISGSIGRIRILEKSKALVEDLNMQVYAFQIRQNLQAELRKLQFVLDRKRRREKRRDEAPRGARAWLLFYRPEGFDGWLVHSLFYGCAVLLVTMAQRALHYGRFDVSSDFVGGAAAYLVILLYLRWAALRLKRVAVLLRQRRLDRINGDLGLLRRTFLVFKPKNEWALLLHIEYYVFVAATSLGIPALLQRASGSGKVSAPFLWEVIVILVSVFLLLARILAADALAWRFLSTLSNSETSQTIAPTGSAS